MNGDLRLTVVIPTFNESENVAEVARRVEEALGPDGWEIVFVDDDSPDGTADAVREIGRADRRIRCVQRVGRRGLSTACIEGMLATAAPVLAVMDGDLQHDERVLPQMLEKIDGGAELVIGTRYAEGGSTGDWDESRASASRLATRVSHWVLKQEVSDPMSGFFMLRRDVLEEALPQVSGIGFKILVDVLASVDRKLKVEEVPYTFRTRFAGESKLDEMVIWEYGMLLADKKIGHIVPVRFLSFAIVGGMGLFVHMAVLSVLKVTGASFLISQATATSIAMVFNFAINNVLTYRDRRLRGGRWWWGLFTFSLACSIGAVANVGIATAVLRALGGEAQSGSFGTWMLWFLAAFAGVLVGAVWNFAVTQLYTWKKSSK